jgi:hypothetical protein
MKRVPVLQVPERDCCPIQYASSLQPLLVLKLRSKRCQWQMSQLQTTVWLSCQRFFFLLSIMLFT